MNCEERTACAVTHAQDLEELYTFSDFPIYMGCTDAAAGQDKTADMEWVVSRSSGAIQLKKLIPPEVLYAESHNAGSIGGLWLKHHASFAAFIHNYLPGSVFEIGGGHGVLAREHAKYQSIPWTILEPNPSPVEGTPAQYIKGFFDESFAFEGSFDAVVHSHVLEHMYHPDTFLKQLSSFIPEGKYLIFSLPRMAEMLKRKYTNCINFEHTIFLTEPYIEYLLAKNGFRIEAQKYFMEDHSIFYCAVKDASVTEQPLPAGLYESNVRLYRDYIAYHEQLVAELNQRIEACDVPVFLFGAHVFAQYLLMFGLSEERLQGLLDNDPLKQGKRLYGTGQLVYSPKHLKSLDRAAVILKAGVYNEEIKKDILENINDRIEFWE
ncbi:MAG: class I SAM-dependent methyltransferase [Pontiellaceae bacterium]|nr:class I SAM-dependent methyltransferase [Pontiellaceae bacterium]MBN2784152.1 class I SAM-dependent methyltransferase [Pontiellaceae bacterium]